MHGSTSNDRSGRRQSWRPTRRVLTRWILGTLVATCLASTAWAESEDQVMAAFLLNFARYVEWPADAFASAEEPVRICMLASPAFGDVVTRTVSGKSVGDRKVEVEMKLDLASTKNCHVLFIGSNVAASNADAVAALRDASVLTVADREGFADAGGIANFFRENNKIRFEINPAAAKEADLKISSRLLRLARVVN